MFPILCPKQGERGRGVLIVTILNSAGKLLAERLGYMVGFRMATSVRGVLTGRGGDFLIIDEGRHLVRDQAVGGSNPLTQAI